MLFLLYTAELFDVITECGCTGHAYADDTQVYVSTPAEDHSDAVDRLTSCIIRVRDWMARDRLKLNEDKTQVIWLGTRQQLDKVMVQTLELQNATVPFSSVVDDLGVLLDSELTIIRLRHSADPVSSTCDSSGPSNSQQSTGLLQQSAGCC